MILEECHQQIMRTLSGRASGALFNWASLVNTATAAALDGNAAANRVAGVGGTVSANWANGQPLWLRWIERNDGANGHGLAIDSYSLTAGSAVSAVPLLLPLPAALMGAGMAAFGWVGRGRSIKMR